ncbi:hypothetical protein [uncultured Phascolarctobacterium sp.]|jgi:hypothetical protein|uniref:hypothetical protein n=1 Tax=uncultured Phascolarctobacterium sp. TaxID=512296 RepID=UPI0025F40AF5|nr:hypothetical protein [uncultured Phascolarctobacterium sp.]
MEYKALVSFAGLVCGIPGQTIVIDDKATADDLLAAGYIEAIEEPAAKCSEKAVAENETEPADGK